MGSVPYAYCGCPEGRGFDELGDKGFLAGQVSLEGAELQFVPFARRRYRIMEVDVTDGDPAALVSAALPAGAEEDIYRVVLTGSPAAPVSPERVQSALSGGARPAGAGQDHRPAGAVGQVRRGHPAGPVSPAAAQHLRRGSPVPAPDGAGPRAFGLAAIDDREV